MTTLIVFGSIDGTIESDSLTYSTARAGSSLVTSTNLSVGQEDGYTIYESFITCDASAIPDGAVISSVVAELYMVTDNSDLDFWITMALRDYGATLTTADWVAGASLAALTTVAQKFSSTLGAGYNTFDNVAFPANLSKTAATRLILYSARHAANNAPGGVEYVEFRYSGSAGTTQDPKFTITYTDAPLTFLPSGIASAAAVQAAALILSVYPLSPSSVPSAEALGAVALIKSLISVNPESVNSGELTGTPTLAAVATISPGSTDSAESVGTPSLALIVRPVQPSAIDSAEAVNVPTIYYPWLIVLPAVSSGEQLGAPQLVAVTTVASTAVDSAEAVGTPSLALSVVTIAPVTADLATGLGTPALAKSPISIVASAVDSAEASGSPALIAVAQIAPGAIADAAAVGTAALVPVAKIAPSAVNSGELLGTPNFLVIISGLLPTSVDSGEAVGTPSLRVSKFVGASFVDSAESVRTPALSQLAKILPAPVGNYFNQVIDGLVGNWSFSMPTTPNVEPLPMNPAGSGYTFFGASGPGTWTANAGLDRFGNMTASRYLTGAIGFRSNQKQWTGLKPDSKYILSAWIKSNGSFSALSVAGSSITPTTEWQRTGGLLTTDSSGAVTGGFTTGSNVNIDVLVTEVAMQLYDTDLTITSVPNFAQPSLLVDNLDESIKLSGATVYFKKTDAALLPTNVTLALWFRTTDTKAVMYIAGAGDTGFNGYYITLFAGVLTISVGKGDGATRVTFSATGSVADGLTHFAVLTHDGITARLYLDGVLVNSAAAAFPLGYGAITEFGIGTLQTLNAARYYNGSIDEVRVYNRALTADEVTTLYSLGSGGVNRPTLKAVATVEPPSIGDYYRSILSGLLAEWRLDDVEPPVNIIANPGFEVNTTGWAAAFGAPISRVTSEAHSGVASLEVIGGAGNQGATTGYVNVVLPSTSYRVSAWVKDTSAGIVLQVDRATAAVAYIGTTILSNTSGSGAWRRIHGTFTTDANCARLQVAVYKSTPTAKTFYIDDVFLELAAVVDSSGAGRDLEAVGFSTRGAAGLIAASNAAFLFDGIDQFLRRTDAALRPANVSLAVWIKTTDTKATMYFGGAGDTGNQGYSLWVNAGIVIAKVGSGSSIVSITTSHQVADGLPHLVVLTHDGANLSVYVDGLLAQGNNTAAAAFPIGYGGITIFGLGMLHTVNTARYFNGTMDEVRLYDRALTPTEILYLYSIGSGGVNRPQLLPGNVNFAPAGIASAQAVGTPSLVLSGVSVQPTAVGAYERSVISGLIGYWRLDEPSGALAAAVVGDAASYQNAPTQGVPGLIAGDTNRAVRFDGINDWISLPATARVTAAHSFVVWFERLGDPNGAGDDSYHSLVQGLTNGVFPRLLLTADGANLLLQMVDTAGSARNTALIPVSAASGRHLFGWTYDGTSARVYFDGVQVGATLTCNGMFNPGTSIHRLGMHSSTGTYASNGIMDEPRIYDRQLSAAEVAHLYTFGSGGVSSPSLISVAEITASSIASQQAVGTPSLLNHARVLPDATASEEVLGTPELVAVARIDTAAITSQEVFGLPSLVATAAIVVESIAPVEALGLPELYSLVTLAPSAIDSEESFGTPEITNDVSKIISWKWSSQSNLVGTKSGGWPSTQENLAVSRKDEGDD